MPDPLEFAQLAADSEFAPLSAGPQSPVSGDTYIEARTDPREAGGNYAIPVAPAANTFTNLGAGPTEHSTEPNRIVVDLIDTSDIRVNCHVTTAGTTGDLKLQYSTDGSTFADLTTLIDLASTGLKSSAFQATPTAALALCLVRCVAVGGDGIEDPVVRGVTLDVRAKILPSAPLTGGGGDQPPPLGR